MADDWEYRAQNLTVRTIPIRVDNYMYLLMWDNGYTAVVDAGEASPIVELCARLERTVDVVLTTHHHADHIAGIAELKARFSCRIIGPSGGRIPHCEHEVGDGDVLAMSGVSFDVLETPGHTVADVAYHCRDAGILFCGDTLFAAGCGRLSGGDATMMWRSLSRLGRLPPDTTVFCGHEYTASNIAFARHIDPNNRDLMERESWVAERRARGLPTVPFRLAEELVTNPFMRCDTQVIREAVAMPDASPVMVFRELRSRKDRF